MRYEWHSPDSLIHQAKFFSPHKEEEALLYAPKGADPVRLRSLHRGLSEAGYATTPDVEDGQYVLRVQKYPSRTALLSRLETLDAISGTHERHATEEDAKEKTSLAAWAKEHSMVSSGWFYLLADAMMIYSGQLRKKFAKEGGKSESWTGLLWALTSLELAFFGEKKPDRRASELYRHVAKSLEKEGIPLPELDKAALDKLALKEGLVNNITSFLYNHPVDIQNSIQGLGGVMLAKAGWQQKNPYDDSRNKFKAFAGSSVAVGQWTGWLVPEKKRDPERATVPEGEKANTHHTVWGEFVDWLQDKPLRFTGMMSAANNISNAIGAFFYERPRIQKFDEGGSEDELSLAGRQKKLQELEANTPEWLAAKEDISDRVRGAKDFKLAYKYNLASAATYAVANYLYGLSSKQPKAKLSEMGKLNELYAVTAAVIAAHPGLEQKDIIHRIAGHLASDTSIDEPPETIARRIEEKVAQMKHNPWVERVSPEAMLAGRQPETGTQPAL